MWTISAIWWQGYQDGNHGMMGWAVAISDMVAAGMRSRAQAADYREDIVRVGERRWLPWSRRR
jgi:hypothetical protein